MNREDLAPYGTILDEFDVYLLLVARCHQVIKLINSNKSVSVDLLLTDHELHQTAAVDATLSKLRSDGWIALLVSGKGKYCLRIIDPYAPFWRRLLAMFLPLST